ncbi:hypothetical protein K6U06_21950 [Acidiferrimicrobium sp. IK]|uniref:hypothetical protein n=1 Tax=Acidiferrimicrobium sp. IK TaxID=2871700 RepID=UPI0021CAFBFA|nr:hypothetical protein [Acidiferrimicrobium sp. IK]MCU4187044.1 hypothetical protein [Acidiferrimicrobium sp. IK]
MGTGYNILVMLHLICVIGGFGGLAYNGLTLALASRRGPDSVAVLEVNAQVTQLAELLIYGAFLFGMAAIGASKSTYGFGQAWVGAALGLYAVDLGLLHGLIRPARKRYATLAEELSKVTVLTENERPPQVAQLDALATRISLGWGAFNVVVLVVVYLMIFKPGA